jgi:peroxiredoxin
VVLGFDSADKRQIALDLLQKQGLTFPCVLDSSDAAIATTYQAYRATAVPMTYLIDREGKIAAAWLGFDEKDQRLPALLKKLGIE